MATPVSGNIGTLSVTEADLLARAPTLQRQLPANQGGWQPQIEAGKVDALESFRAAKQHAPESAKAADDDEWKRVLSFFALAVIYGGFGSQFDAQAAAYSRRAAEALDRFVYRYDEDGDGVIEAQRNESDDQESRDVILRR